MRTTVDIDEDVLNAARELGRRQRRTLGEVVSVLMRRALTTTPEVDAGGGRVAESESFYGFVPFPSRGVLVTNELIDRLREETGD